MTVDRVADRDKAEKLEMLASLRPIDDVFMCEMMEEYGRKIKSRRERDIAVNLLNAGIDSAIVAQCTGIPLSQVNEISRVGPD